MSTILVTILFGLIGVIVFTMFLTIAWISGLAAGELAKFSFQRNPNNEKITFYVRRVTFVSVALLLTSWAYIGLYPTDSCYLDEYKTVTMQDAPPSARVIAKFATYPDLQGSYCSFSRIHLGSKTEFDKIQLSIKTSPIFSVGDGLYVKNESTSTFADIPTLASFTRIDPHYPGGGRSIKFLSDMLHVEINLCTG